MIRTALLGLPRIGPDRELKFALESCWSGETGVAALLDTARDLRADAWKQAVTAGIDVIPSGDSSLYDHLLDTIWGVGAIPERFGSPQSDDLEGYFRMARGDRSAKPLEMTKWFDTNYHYLVPEMQPGQTFEARPGHWVSQYLEARGLGIETRPVLVGPFTLLKLTKGLDHPLKLIDKLATVYQEILLALGNAGAREIQIDEPALVTDLTSDELQIFESVLGRLTSATDLDLTVSTYFAGLDHSDVLDRLAKSAIHELHIDLVRAPKQLGPALDAFADSDMRLSLGIVDGRNVWVTDFDPTLNLIDTAVARLGADRITLAPSCSLLHSPYEAARETGIDPAVHRWLAFGAERLDELALLKRAASAGRDERNRLLSGVREAVGSRRESSLVNDPAVRRRTEGLRSGDYARSAPYSERRAVQREILDLPELPTTTIGSYPQTAKIRERRKAFREGRIDSVAYEQFLESEISHVVEVQEKLGLDVLVHGEPERNDMVEYFGQQLDGFAFSSKGWVQSYGSRCVKPPIIFGDVSRPAAMTVDWWRRAQDMTRKPMKGMLTGPVTILQWSFVRNDQPRRETCTQIALAIQDEVIDLERAGAAVIQVDEAALREGLPIQHHDQYAYVNWAIDCFRLTAAPAKPETQIHTHMCYSEFNDMMEHIIRLDADVLSIEASRSGMEVLDAFTGNNEYPNEIGPGIYDIHSPRIPTADEMELLLEVAEKRIPRQRLWVNPDCGLKTRSWDQVMPALEAMMEATRRRRSTASEPRHV